MAQQHRRHKANNFWGTIARLIKYMSSHKWYMAFALITGIVAILLGAIAPSVMGMATEEAFRALGQAQDEGLPLTNLPINYDLIIRIVIAIAVIFILQAVTRYIQNVLLALLSQETVYDLRRDLKEKMGTLPIKFFDTHGNGDIMSRAVNDMDQISNTLQQSLIQFINGSVMFFGVLVVMLWVNWRLAIVVILTAPISGGFIYFLAPKAQREFTKQQKELGVLTDHVEEVYGGHTIVKTYNREEDEIDRFLDQSSKLNKASTKAQYLSIIMNPLVNFARDLGYFGVGVVGGYGVINGTISIGHVQAFMQYVNQFAQPVRFIAQLSNTIQLTVASCERVFEIIDEEPMEDTHVDLDDKEDSPYKVEFEHVQFGYDDDPDADLLMHDFNLKVKPGEMIAIVGPTGAGKSTLINLLERFYDVKGGSIRIDGVDTRNIDRDVLRDRISMVLQDTWLFNGTIWENIAYGNDEYADDEERILKASKAAHVHDFVKRLPKGYSTIINEEGSNISQGQRQLITIARAFLADPEILILDEATSSVDTRTEALIQEAMNNILEDRTSFVIAHRLSTIQDADKIIVMNHGDVMETGTHDELLEQDGFYASLYNAQFTSVDDAVQDLGWDS